jgi:pyrroloquinoline quinone biosynthesis protein B
MYVKVLGSAAGGGFPQWNCACKYCNRMRSGVLRGSTRTQAQVAVSADGGTWFLLNASPDLRQQILATPELAPSAPQRSSPIAGVVLTSADVDAVVGLLHLREFQPLRIFSTRGIRRIVTDGNILFRTLERSAPPVEWCDLPLDKEVALAAGIRCAAISLGGAYPEYVDAELRKTLAPEDAVIGLVISDGHKKLLYAPGLSGKSAGWKAHVEASDLALVDGTYWTDDELIQVRGSGRTAREMGHLPLSGRGGLLEELRGATRPRRVAIHINNTNPILDEESVEHRAMLDAGWEVAHDGMEFTL